MKIPFEQLKSTFKTILLRHSFNDAKAEICAAIFAENSRDGVYSHGLNRFPVFIQMVREGYVRPNADPSLISQAAQVEHWDGNLGAGMYNARFAMNRAIEISKVNGIGMVTLKNTNHWMRGGSYGWQAAEAGCIGICTSNTIANMPPWGGKEPRLGNNPLVIGVPHKGGHIILDMAISQYSYGALQGYMLKNRQLPVTGGYDEDGKLSTDAAAIYQSKRVLPIGSWKGSGLSLILDVLLTSLTGGQSVKTITDNNIETGLTQLFICIYQQQLHDELVSEIITYTKSSSPDESGGSILYPGENSLKTRVENMRSGIPVDESIWNELLKL